MTNNELIKIAYRALNNATTNDQANQVRIILNKLKRAVRQDVEAQLLASYDATRDMGKVA